MNRLPLPVGMTPDQVSRLRLELDVLGGLLYEQMLSRLDGPSGLILAALRGLGMDPRSSARIGTGLLGDVADRHLEILAWRAVDRLLALGVDRAGPPEPGELEAALASLAGAS